FTLSRVRDDKGSAAHQPTHQTIQAAHSQAKRPVITASGGANMPIIPVNMPVTIKGKSDNSVVRVASGDTRERRPVSRITRGRVAAWAPKLVARAKATKL